MNAIFAKILWHICHACNYGCEYCYSQYLKASNRLPIVYKNEVLLEKFLYECLRFADALQVPIKDFYITLVGGEPTLIDELSRIVRKIKGFGLKVCLITNGSREDRLLDIATELEVLKISLNTFDEDIACASGCCERVSKDYMDKAKFARFEKEFRTRVPKTEMKANVVVSRFNCQSPIIAELQEYGLDGIKVFRQAPMGGDTGITDEEWQTFLDINGDACRRGNVKIVDDTEMCGLYIDPYGRIVTFDNATGNRYSDPIYEEGGIDRALRQIKFDVGKYAKRYM